jgi:hypothetical protein
MDSTDRMRILVQNSNDYSFWAGNEAWSPSDTGAFEFQSSQEALVWIREQRLPNARVVLKFKESHLDCVFNGIIGF